MQIFEEMNDAGVVPGLVTYNTVIAACVRAERPDEALGVFRLMDERCIKRDQVSITLVLTLGKRTCSSALGFQQYRGSVCEPTCGIGWNTGTLRYQP